MTKPTIFLVGLSFFAIIGHGQQITNTGQRVIDSSGDNPGSGTISLPFFDSPADAKKIVRSIMEAIGVEGNFKIKAARVPNVEATIKHHQRYILYNPSFIEQVNHETNNKWAAIFILAHEVAHHLEGHTLVDIRERPVVELQADQFAGYTLRRMGASLAQAQVAMHYIANAEPSKTHPGRESRLAAIQRGWEQAESQMSSLASKTGNGNTAVGAPN